MLAAFATKRPSDNSSIAYSFGIGQFPGVISSPGALFGSNVNSIASPMVPNVPTQKTAVTIAQQSPNIQASIVQAPNSSDTGDKKIAGIVGTVFVLGVLVLLFK